MRGGGGGWEWGWGEETRQRQKVATGPKWLRFEFPTTWELKQREHKFKACLS